MNLELRESTEHKKKCNLVFSAQYNEERQVEYI